MARKPTPPKVFGSKPQLSNSSSIMTAKGKANPYGPENPVNNPTNNAALVKHVRARLDSFDSLRNAMLQRFKDVDIQLSGFVKLEPEDRERQKRNKRGEAPRPVKHNLPLAAAQLDEAVTYLLSVFAPDGDMFEAVAPPHVQNLAKVLARHMNKNGQRVGYYTQLSKFLANAMKYNLGILETSWEDQEGIVWGNDLTGQAKATTQIVWSGNILRSLDMYNTMFDPTVAPIDLPLRGEFYATVDLVTPFRARKMESDKQIFYVDRFVEQNGNYGARYYREKPNVREPNTGSPGNTIESWTSVMSAGAVQDVQPGIELIRYVGWITPSDFGLSDSKDLELWRIIIANGEHVCATTRLDDSAGMLPIGVTTPIIDDLDNSQRTYAEQLVPLQHFASFLLNSHQDSVRKALGGLKVYDPTVLPGLDKAHDDLYSALVPMKSTGVSKDIDKIFRTYNDVPHTEGNVADIAKISQLMQQILPTDMLQQVADLDRATLYQAAATVQASNRRSLKIARLILSQALTNVKSQMLYNVYSSQQQVDVPMPDGSMQKLDPAAIRSQRLELELAGGMKALDRLMTAQVLRDIIMMVLQSQAAMAEIDVLALLDYYTSITGDVTDLTKFRRQTPAPALPSGAPDGASPVTPGAPEQPPIPQG